MATTHNKSLLAEAGLWDREADEATPNDLCIAFICDSQSSEEKILAKVDEFLSRRKSLKTDARLEFSTIKEAVASDSSFNFCLISVPGEYAVREAQIALEHDLNVMMFSDNVSLDDELKLKQLAVEKNLLLMGPDCGTAIIDGVGLGFSNKVRRGHIGIVGASGTGIQEVSVLLDRMGLGISQAIGTGGRDLKKEIGALMMQQGLKRLADDLQTEVIVLISKPPHPDNAKKILQQLEKITKPSIVCLLGFDGEVETKNQNIYLVKNLTEAAQKAAEISGVSVKSFASLKDLPKKKGRIYGLFCGGTLASEAALVLGSKHEVIDFGDDEYTKGRPHPMIDPSIRNEAFLKFSREENTAVFLFDIVLCYGIHADPAGNLAPTIQQIKRERDIIFIASVCGCEQDPQGYSAQVKKLESVGVIIAPCNLAAAQFAISVVS